MAIAKGLLRLTSARATGVFILSFGLGCASILYNYRPIIVTSLILVAYSFVLWVAQTKYYQALSSETKNSPYFLGFLYTLVCIFNIFYKLPHEAELTTDLQVFLVPQIGTALLTTIVGLIARQIIITTDPVQETQAKLFQAATDELKENISSYKLAQQKLMDLINEFTATRSELIEEEQKASKEHLALLTESSTALGKLGQQYPPKIRKLLDNLDKIENKFDTFLNEALPNAFKGLNENTLSHLEYVNESFVQSSKDMFDKMNAKIAELDERIQSFGEGFDTCNSTINDGFKESLTQVQTEFSGLATAIGSLKGHFQSSNNGFKSSLASVQESCAALEKQISSFDQLHTERLAQFKQELKEVDELIDMFIDATKKKLR